jgi:hypothetical protein
VGALAHDRFNVIVSGYALQCKRVGVWDWFAAINEDFRISFRMVLVKKRRRSNCPGQLS